MPRWFGLPAAAVSLAAVALSLLTAAPALAFGVESQPGLEHTPSGDGFGFTIPGDQGGFERGPSGEFIDRPMPPSTQPASATPVIHRDLASLPPAVAEMRSKIIAAAKAADYTDLARVVGLSDPPPVFSSAGDVDAVTALKAASGDDAGLEVLAILLDVLDAGWVVKDEGTPQARYIWPYFAELPPDSLSRQQLVEAYRLMTAGDFEQMRSIGSYEFYRLEIAADGRWLLFMSGE